LPQSNSSSAVPPVRESIYRLKGMVLVRLLAEATALLILLVLPIILLIHGDFAHMSLTTRIIVCVLSVVSLLVLPFYTTIAHKVKLDEEGVSTYSLVTSQHAEWAEISALKLKASWGWRRYVVSADRGDLTVPVWMTNLPELVASIRQKLPNRGFGGPVAAQRIFHQDAVSLIIQSVKSLAALLFLGVFWAFAYSLRPGATTAAQKTDTTDFLIVVAACVVVSSVVLLRVYLTSTMPRRVELQNDGLLVQTLFYKFKLPWNAIARISAPWFFLPDGLLVRSKGNFFLIGDQLEAFDELHEALVERFPPQSAAVK
jgi:hypothetical protein